MILRGFTSVRLLTAALATSAMCSSLILHLRATGESSQQQSLIEIERRWLDQEDNPAALESILADDFIHVLPFGFVTKAEQLRYIRAHPAPERGSGKHFEDLRVRVIGSAGVVNGIVVATMPGGKARKTIFTDVFAYRGGTWHAVNAQELPFNDSARP